LQILKKTSLILKKFSSLRCVAYFAADFSTCQLLNANKSHNFVIIFAFG